MPDPIPAQLTRIRDIYALHLARVAASPIDPLFKQTCVEDLEKAIAALDYQLANLTKGA